MPPRLNLFAANRAASTLRQSTVSSATRSIALPLRTSVQKRWNSSNESKPEDQKLSTPDSISSVSEEAAEMARILEKEKGCDGQPTAPELQQGSPVSEILQRDAKARKLMPKVMQDQLKDSKGSRSFSTSTRRSEEDTLMVSGDASAAILADMVEQLNLKVLERTPGLKFDEPDVSSKPQSFRKRYDNMQDQFTKMIMQDGKLARAQKNMSIILDHLRTSSPPSINPRRPLLGGPPAAQLPFDPILYLTLIIDSVAPLFRIRQQKGISGGGTAVQVPHPLNLRQRRRAAIKWIIDASNKRRDAQLAHRLANELVAIAEGRSGVWERRDQQHKIGIAGRANLGLAPRRR